MRSFVPVLLLFITPVLLVTGGARAAGPAAAVAELGAFSVFPNIDPAQLAKSDVKAARGPAMSDPSDLSVQTCYVVPGTPANALKALQDWDASRHPELKIYLHADLPVAPTAASFGRLRAAPDNGSVRALAAATQKLGPDLQISRDEAKALPAATTEDGSGGLPSNVAAFWASLLAARAQSFASGGAASQGAYDHSAHSLRPGEALAGLLRQQEKVRRQFSLFLGECGVTGGRPALKPENYYELSDVEDEGVLTLGAFFSKPVGSGFQALDLIYYASGGYNASLTLYQMWPVDLPDGPATLVWRGDLISSASLAALHGVERMGSESAMMKDVAKAITLFKRDTAHGH